jgi:hypothetical protein
VTCKTVTRPTHLLFVSYPQSWWPFPGSLSPPSPAPSPPPAWLSNNMVPPSLPIVTAARAPNLLSVTVSQTRAHLSKTNTSICKIYKNWGLVSNRMLLILYPTCVHIISNLLSDLGCQFCYQSPILTKSFLTPCHEPFWPGPWRCPDTCLPCCAPTGRWSQGRSTKSFG